MNYYDDNDDAGDLRAHHDAERDAEARANREFASRAAYVVAVENVLASGFYNLEEGPGGCAPPCCDECGQSLTVQMRGVYVEDQWLIFCSEECASEHNGDLWYPEPQEDFMSDLGGF